MGAKVLAAAGLKQIGARTLGFQNSGSSVAAPHPRSTTQRKPFVPFTAVAYPPCRNTITSAPSEMDLGAPLRARAISALSGIMYSLNGAIAGYALFFACASAGDVVHPTTINIANAKAANDKTMTLALFFCMQFSKTSDELARCRLAYITLSLLLNSSSRPRLGELR